MDLIPASQASFFVSDGSHAGSSWDGQALLELCDTVRSSLAEGKGFGSESDKLLVLLEAMIRDEMRASPSIDFDTIEKARLDKLVADILEPTKRPAPLTMKFRTALSAANSLQRMWRARHKERYFTIDQDRCNILISTGLLKDVSFAATRADDVPAWMAKEIAPASEVASDLKDDVGNWWLNIACAHRDGMVESSQERPSKSRYGTAILPLLTGKEEISDDGVVKYIREGRQRDMHISLISQVGSETGILRGYRLKSVYAPSARIRYDGLYRIRQWGQKLDVNTNIYRLEVTLDRVKGQKSMDDVKKTPKPSQIDDWHLYEKLESEWIKQRQGDTAFMDWRMRREEEKVDREQWRRTREFRSSLSAPRKKWKSGTSKLLTTSKVLGRMPRIRSKSPEPVARRPTVVFNEGIPETPL